MTLCLRFMGGGGRCIGRPPIALPAAASAARGRRLEAAQRYAHVVEMGGRPARVAAGYRGLGFTALQVGSAPELGRAAEHFAKARRMMMMADAEDAAEGRGGGGVKGAEVAAVPAEAVVETTTSLIALRCHGLVLRRQGKYIESQAVYRSCCERSATVVDAPQAATVAAAQLGLALSLWRAGDLSSAAAVWPTELSHVPAAQSLQSDGSSLPVVSSHFPSTQGMQWADAGLPTSVLYCPAAQSVQSLSWVLAMSSAYLPAMHAMQSPSSSLPVTST